MQPSWKDIFTPTPTWEPPPVLDAEEVKKIVMSTDGQREWEWGPDYMNPGFSKYAGLPWWVICMNEPYMEYLHAKAETRPKHWDKFMTYVDSIRESEVYTCLPACMTDAQKLRYLRDSMGSAGEAVVKRMKLAEPTAVQSTFNDIMAGNPTTLNALEDETIGGFKFKDLLTMDEANAVLFSAYVMKRSGMASSLVGSSREGSVQASVHENGECEEEDEEEEEEEPAAADAANVLRF